MDLDEIEANPMHQVIVAGAGRAILTGTHATLLSGLSHGDARRTLVGAVRVNSRILAPLGLEADPYYLSDGDGVSFVLGGLNLRTRDYARFGQMILQGGEWQGLQVVPRDWARAMTSRQAQDGSEYGFQWWIPQNPAPGEVMAQGIYGQWIYINPALGVVIAVNSADRGFEDPGVYDGSVAMLRAIAAGL